MDISRVGRVARLILGVLAAGLIAGSPTLVAGRQAEAQTLGSALGDMTDFADSGETSQARDLARRIEGQFASDIAGAPAGYRSLIEGEIAYAMGDYQTAADKLQAGPSFDSLPQLTAPRYYRLLGSAQLRLGRTSDAIRNLERAVELYRATDNNTRNGPVLTRLGEAYRLVGRRAEARTTLEEAARTDTRGGKGLAYLQLALLDFEEGNYNGATGNGKTAINILRGPPPKAWLAEAYVIQGRARLKLYPTMVGEAWRYADMAREQDSRSPALLQFERDLPRRFSTPPFESWRPKFSFSRDLERQGRTCYETAPERDAYLQAIKEEQRRITDHMAALDRYAERLNREGKTYGDYGYLENYQGDAEGRGYPFQRQFIAERSVVNGRRAEVSARWAALNEWYRIVAAVPVPCGGATPQQLRPPSYQPRIPPDYYAEAPEPVPPAPRPVAVAAIQEPPPPPKPAAPPPQTFVPQDLPPPAAKSAAPQSPQSSPPPVLAQAQPPQELPKKPDPPPPAPPPSVVASNDPAPIKPDPKPQQQAALSKPEPPAAPPPKIEPKPQPVTTKPEPPAPPPPKTEPKPQLQASLSKPEPPAAPVQKAAVPNPPPPTAPPPSVVAAAPPPVIRTETLQAPPPILLVSNPPPAIAPPSAEPPKPAKKGAKPPPPPPPPSGPEAAKLAVERGSNLLAQARYEPAQKEFAAARAADASNVDAQAGALAASGFLKLQAGQITPAMDDLNAANRLRPIPEAYEAIGRILAANGKPGGAIAQFDEAIRLRPGYTQALFGRAQARLERGAPVFDRADFTLAGEDYKAVLAVKPDMPEALMGLAKVQFLTGDYAGASTSIASVLQLRPIFPEATYVQARTRYEQGQFQEVLKDLVELPANFDPFAKACTTGLAYEGLGDAALIAKDDAKATEFYRLADIAYRQALALRPSDPRVLAMANDMTRNSVPNFIGRGVRTVRRATLTGKAKPGRPPTATLTLVDACGRV